MTISSLLFRRQFLLTPSTCPSLRHWQHIRVGYFNLYAHPDVSLSTATSAGTNVTVALIGDIIDPGYPERSNAAVLDAIAKFSNSIEAISEYLHFLGGRFVLIINTPKDTFVFHDPCGLRTVYFTKHGGKVYIGSQPYIFKQVMPLRDGERLSFYINSSYAKTHLEHWIPSGCTLFEDVHHLVPNHYLRLSTLEQIRYWPQRILPQRGVREVVAEASDLLAKLMIAANNRFKLALPLTAGWDSRILLSASKGISDEIYFYTLQYRHLHSESDDIRIPAKLLPTLGLRHNTIDCRKTVSEAFSEVYQRNAALAHMDDWGKIAYGMLDTYPQDRICIKGNCSEIARCYYYPNGNHQPIMSPDEIVSYEDGWDTIAFIQDQIATWYDRTIDVTKETNIDILDLFYWEHRMGSWQAQSQLEMDIVQDAFTPFNHRGLLELLLSVSAKLRSYPNYTLYRMIIEALWPEIMREPVNPETATQRFRKMATQRSKNVLRHIGMYETIRHFYKERFRRKP